MITAQDLQAMLAHMPPLSPVLGQANAAQGALAPLCGWLQSFAQFNSRPSLLRRPRVAVFAASDEAILQTLKTPEASLNKLCLAANADLRAYDLGEAVLGNVAQAFTYGLLALEDGVDVLLPYATLSSADAAVQLQQALIANPNANAFDLLQANGSVAMAAMCGAMLAARMAQVPVLIDDATGQCAAQWLAHWHPNAANHVFNLSTHNPLGVVRPAAEQGLLLLPLLRGLR